MCIAIINTEAVLDRATFHSCWEHNPDGGGIAYIDNKKVKILKEMQSVDNLYRQYVSIRENNKLPMIIHFRIATSGSVEPGQLPSI